MSKFKAGDRVRCVEPGHPVNRLQRGEIYTVMDGGNDEFISVEGVQGERFARRFELAEPERPDALEWLKEQFTRGRFDHLEIEPMHAMLREVYGLEVKYVPASTAFVPVGSA